MEKQIEIRSRKIRNLIGAVPSRLERYGITVIAAIVALLIAAAAFVPWPETTEAEAVVQENGIVVITLPYRHVNDIKKDMAVTLEFEGFKAEDYGYVRGTIVSKSMEEIPRGNAIFFNATVKINKTKYTLRRGMRGTATVLLANQTVIEKII